MAEADHQKFVVPYDEFDITVDDISGDDFGVFGWVENLSPGNFSSAEPFPVKGWIGKKCRLMVPLVVQRAREPNSPVVNVWFLVNTSSPYTCLTEKSMKAISSVETSADQYAGPFAIQDQNSNIECWLSKNHFKNVNILGIRAMQDLKLSLDIDWEREEFKLIRK